MIYNMDPEGFLFFFFSIFDVLFLRIAAERSTAPLPPFLSPSHTKEKRKLPPDNPPHTPEEGNGQQEESTVRFNPSPQQQQQDSELPFGGKYQGILRRRKRQRLERDRVTSSPSSDTLSPRDGSQTPSEPLSRFETLFPFSARKVRERTGERAYCFPMSVLAFLQCEDPEMVYLDSRFAIRSEEEEAELWLYFEDEAKERRRKARKAMRERKKFRMYDDEDDDDDSYLDDQASSIADEDTSNMPRGRYKCGRCGKPKVNHICPYENDFMRSTSTQVDLRITRGGVVTPSWPNVKVLSVSTYAPCQESRSMT